MISTNALSLSIQFHLSVTEDDSASLHIFHVVLSINWRPTSINKIIEAVTEMDQLLSRLPYLQQVIAVMPDLYSARDPLSDKFVLVKDKVLVMGEDEYTELFGQLRNGTVPGNCPIRPPLWIAPDNGI